MKMSEQEKINENIDKTNLIQKFENRDLSNNLTQNLKLLQSIKNGNSEELMNIEPSENSENPSLKFGINSNKIVNIVKDNTVFKTMPLEMTTEMNHLKL